MSDQDMIDAGVNTIGARRKLLKVFENVARHCTENVSVLWVGKKQGLFIDPI